MDVFAGNSLSIPLNVILAGSHVDTDDNEVTAVLLTHPSIVPTVTRLGLGRYLLTFSSLSPALEAGIVTECVVTVTIDAVEYTPYGIPITVVASSPVVVASTPEPIEDGSVAALNLARTAITEMINALRVIPDGDTSLPEVLEYTIGRKQVTFTGPMRRAQALVALTAELRSLERELRAANRSANQGSSFIRLAI